MSFSIRASIAEEINYAASHQKKQAVVKDIIIDNAQPGSYILKISSKPEFFFEYKKIVNISKSTASLKAPSIAFNDSFYRTDLIEAQVGQITIEISDTENEETVLGFLQEPVHIQPYLHWDALRFRDTLPAFMQPNDTFLQGVMKKAAEYAAKAGESICGYQCGTILKVQRQAGYIYRALQDMDIHYLSAPASFERYGQKIRIPHQVLHDKSKQGTCLDLAILFASCLEAASLYSAIVVISGHAFAAVHLDGQLFNKTLVTPDDYSKDEWESAITNFLPVECTTFTDGRGIPFESAVLSGKNNLKRVQYILDVENARRAGDFPVYTFTDEPLCDPVIIEESDIERIEFTEEKRSRIARLRDQSMDLTVKSRLLNNTANPLSITCKIDSASFIKSISSNDREKASEELAAEFTKSAKKTILRELYSKSLQNRRETGKNNLFITINELVWKQSSGKSCRALIYLCPAEIYRNRRGEYQLRVNPEGMIFNPALKVLLNQSYHFDSAVFEDQPGEEYVEQIKYMNYLIRDQKGWKVQENIAHLAMYNVPNEAVWNSLGDASVSEHEIVKGILEGRMTWNNKVEKSVHSEEEKAENSIYAFETDSSQREIIESAFERKAQVIVGPAGNGKTQTVVNIMAEAVRRGQKVLFVSEKVSALEIAYSKLNEIFDGLFNLKILYGKDKPLDVIRQIKKTLDYIETHSKNTRIATVDNERKRFNACAEYLEKYYACMNKKGNAGKTLEELINMYEQYSNCELRFTLDDDLLQKSLYDSEETVSRFSVVMEEYERASGRYADYIRYDNLNGFKEKETFVFAQTALEKFEKLSEHMTMFRTKLGLDKSISTKNDMIETMVAVKILEECPIYDPELEEIKKDSKDDEQDYKDQLDHELDKLVHGILVVKKIQKKKCYNLLRKVFSMDLAKQIIADVEKDPEAVLDRLRNDVGEFEIVSDAFKVQKDQESPEEYIRRKSRVLNKLSPDFKGAIRKTVYLFSQGRAEDLRELAEKIIKKYEEYDAAQERASNLIVQNLEAFNKNHPDILKIELIKEWIENRNIDTNRSRSLYDSIVADMKRDGYSGFIEQVEDYNRNSKLNRNDIMNGFYKAWAAAQIRIMQDELLENNEFNHLLFKSRVEQLVVNEQIIRNNLIQEIRRIQFSSVPDIREGVSDDPDFGRLQRLVRKRNNTIRSLFEESPRSIHTLYPCMIMDPSAVAEYIPADFPKFDLVLIDEGSQMPVYNALVPISKAERCVIFGDEKQLQPFDSFKLRGSADDESGDRESILTAAYISSMPRKMLRFHYRSENESLISFSNERYYNGDIITFPSADTSIQGVSYSLVKEGLYDRSKKVNYAEAEQVVSRIKELYEDGNNRDKTLGVITLNIHQRDLIQSLLMQKIQDNSSLGRKTDELVSIVNLESCQGKEWDYVIISPGFGNDENGQFYMGFGALNREYGANRLNVMLTRARKKMMVITSIEPFMLSGASSQGVKDFREFLKYARGEYVLDKRVTSSVERDTRTKANAESGSRTIGSAEHADGLIDSIAKELEAQGYRVHTDIGSSGFKVDLGIVSEADPNKYSLGILLDHFNDKDSSIHDREVIYPSILESKGWRIYRLSGLNWFNDPNGEINQIKRAMGVR